MVTEDDIAEVVVCGPNENDHLERIESFAQAGFDHVYVHQIGPDQSGFFDFYEHRVLEEARELTPRRRVSATA
jgi:coenzyme F420-dependent glucose-6-phosphate dehydrogenase